MKRVLLPVVLLSLPVAVVNCSAEDAPPIVNNGTGGTTGTAGSGTTTTGGDTTGMSGSGTSTTGGTGTSGSGGSDGSTAGSSSGGGMAGSGTAGGDMGGTGGSAGGGEMGGSGGGGGAPPVEVSVGKLDGMLVQTPCGDTPNSDDCKGSGWIYEGQTYGCTPGGDLDTDAGEGAGKLEFAVTGEMGKRYLATMHFYGVMEPKNYGPNAMREAGNQRPNVGSNPSNPPGFATMGPNQTYSRSDYNTYEVHTYDQTGAKIGQYFLNSDTQEGHYTFAVNFARDIEIVGGGKVKVRIFDDNCRMIKNCGTGGFPCASKARTIDLSSANPAPSFQQPGLGKQPDHSGQWIFIDVEKIVPKP